MVDTSDSSFSYVESEDSEYDSSFYETYVEDKFLVDFGDNNTETIDEVTGISGVAVVSEATDSEVVAGSGAGSGVATYSEASSSKVAADVWRFFTRKEKIIKDQNGDEKFEHIILCNVGQCQLSPNNSTTTLERHLKSKHHDAYIELYEKRVFIEPWSVFLKTIFLIKSKPFFLF